MYVVESNCARNLLAGQRKDDTRLRHLKGCWSIRGGRETTESSGKDEKGGYLRRSSTGDGWAYLYLTSRPLSLERDTRIAIICGNTMTIENKEIFYKKWFMYALTYSFESFILFGEKPHELHNFVVTPFCRSRGTTTGRGF